MKKSICILPLVLCLVMLFSACAGSNTGTTPSAPTTESVPTTTQQPSTPKEKIVFSTRLDFTTMDVTNTPSTITKSIYHSVYNTLVEKDVDTNEIIPALAESWTMSSPTEYSFTLRKGVKFHDGSDFTAEDVKFTYERAMDQSSSKSKLASVASIQAEDDYTVKITLKQPNMDFLDMITDPTLSILSKTAFETLGEEEGIQQGTGPYKYKEWNQGSYLDLVANNEYWGGAPVTAELRLQFISESASRLIAVQTGEMDFIQDPPMAELPNIQADPALKLITYPSASVELLFFNTKQAPMDNADVRKAIEYALNRQDIVDGVFLGNASANNNIMHSSNAFYSEIESPETDLEKAKELLAKAGYPNGFELTLISNSSTDSQAICTIVQAQLDEIGITVKYEPVENAAHTTLASSGEGYHMDSCQWSGYAFGPDLGIRELIYSSGSNNYAHISDAKMDQMIDEALTIEDKVERMAAYKAIEEYSEEIMVVYPICVKNYTFVSGTALEDIAQPNGPIMNFRNLVAYK